MSSTGKKRQRLQVEEEESQVQLRREKEDPFAVPKKKVKTHLGKPEGNGNVDGSGEKKKKKERWVDRQKKTVFINQIPYNATEMQIRRFIGSGNQLSESNIAEVKMMSDASGSFKGMAIVVLDSEGSVAKALKLDKMTVNGRPVNVKECLPKEKIEEERAKKKQEGYVSAETLHSAFAKVNREMKGKASPIKLDDFDAGVISLLKKSKYVVVEKSLKEYMEKVSKNEVKNANSLLFRLLNKFGSDTGADGKKRPKQKLENKPQKEGLMGKKDGKAKRDDFAKKRIGGAPNKVTMSESGVLTPEEVQEIVNQSAKPRRSKKKDGQGRLPAATGERWKSFDESSLEMMQRLTVPELKRTLSSFYQISTESKSDTEQNEQFQSLFSKK